MDKLGVFDNISFYQTPAGNTPFEKYIDSLAKAKKDDDITEIILYLNKLSEFGFEINKKFKPNAIKHLQDGVYELRPTSSRIFFFCYVNGMFIILHGWEKKQSKTDPKELKKAINEKNKFLKEQGQ